MASFTFGDLFSGVGGFHLACAKNGGVCAVACEINALAREIYEKNYSITPHDDVATLRAHKHLDLLCAGFPCQSHSTLGLRKGLSDKRGKLFDVLCDYIDKSRPRAFLLENVKGILSSNEGRSFRHVMRMLEKMGYNVSWAVLDSKNFGLPQHRERVFIVGSLSTVFNFDRLLEFKKHKTIADIMDITPHADLRCSIFDGQPIYKRPMHTETGFILRAKMSNFTNRKLFSSDGIVGTIPTASPPPIYDERTGAIRHLSKTELKKCQGFPARFWFPKDASRTTVCYFLGNAVSVNVVEQIVREMRAQKLL